MSCASIETRTPLAPAFTLFDGSRMCPAGAATCIDGRYIVKDIEQTLCDLWDPVESDVAGVDNDRLQISLVDLQETLASVFFDPPTAPGVDHVAEQLDVISATSFGPTNTATAGLGVCRFAEMLVTGGFSRSLVRETLALNKLSCPL